MTLLKTDSFEHGDTSRATVNSATIFTTAGARTGTRVFSSNFSAPSSQTYRVASADEHATFIAGSGVLFGTGGSYSPLIAFGGDGGTIMDVYCGVSATGGAGRFVVVRGTYPGGTIIATGPVVINTGLGAWHYVEMKVVKSDTVGSVVIRLDEVDVLTIGGVDTRQTVGAVFDTVIFYAPVLASSAGYVDDVYICNAAGSVNNDFLGAVHIEYLVPTSTGNSSQGVGSDGDSVNNWALVDEKPVDAADYVAFNATGDKDTYVCADSAFSPARTVKGVTVYSYAEKTDAGARTIDGVARLAGSEVSATMKNASVAPGASPSTDLTNGQYRAMDCVLETKPGGGAWTVGDVNAAEFGVKAS